jgi:hypothetical protein
MLLKRAIVNGHIDTSKIPVQAIALIEKGFVV